MAAQLEAERKEYETQVRLVYPSPTPEASHTNQVASLSSNWSIPLSKMTPKTKNSSPSRTNSSTASSSLTTRSPNSGVLPPPPPLLRKKNRSPSASRHPLQHHENPPSKILRSHQNGRARTIPPSRSHPTPAPLKQRHPRRKRQYK